MPQDRKANDQVREHLNEFDYEAPAEFFPSRNRAGKSRTKYKRFDTAAEALRFVVEDLSPPELPGMYLLVDEKRFHIEEIRYLYGSAANQRARTTR
jgi:hypothetical protein